MKINALQTLGSAFLISATKGEQLYAQIYSALKNGETVEIDLSGIKSTITAFFFSAYGKLFKDFDADFIDKHLFFINLKESSLLQIDDVKKTSISFYKKEDN